jgi:23S rRNA (cytidine1920-2'-O)/16S rRNA (cytidine1409-2'-O)-methyltransferase
VARKRSRSDFPPEAPAEGETDVVGLRTGRAKRIKPVKIDDRPRADNLLVERGVFASRAQARAAIEAGGVTADGAVVDRPSQRLEPDAKIIAAPAHRFVGRGALKLDHALTLWSVPVEGRTVLDVGASTGGFTQVCLERGAARVYAVDVGRGQLHGSLIADRRVIDLSGVDARRLTVSEIAEPPELIVCDASFIGLAKVVQTPLALAAPGADLIALVKPQFELGPDAVGKGGMVRDPADHQRAVDAVVQWLTAAGWPVKAVTQSPIQGGDGAVEHLVWAQRA